MATCCNQDFHPGDEVKDLDNDRLGWVYRIRPTGIRDAIIIKWQDTSQLKAYYSQRICDKFIKTGNVDYSQIG